MADIKNKRVNIYIDQSSAEDALQKLQTKADGFNNKIQKCREQQTKLLDEIKKSEAAGKDVTKLQDKYNNLNTQINATNKSLKDNASALQKLQTKADGFNNKIQKCREQQTKLLDEIKKSEAAGKDVTKLQDKYNNLNTQINATNKSLKDNAAAQQKVADQIKSGIAPSFNQLSRYVSSLHNELKSMSSDMPGYAEKFAAFQKSSQQLHQLKDAMSGVEKAQKSWVSNVGGIAAGVFIGTTVQAGLQAMGGYLSGIVTGNAKLSDSLSDIEKSTGLSSAAVAQLNSELGKIDTRTSTAQLREIAVGLGQIGEAANKDNVAAIDQIVVALGDEFGGGAKEITTTLSVLRNNLSDIKTGDYALDVTHIGNALNTLGAEGLATAPVVTDIANRIAGIGRTFNLSSGQILGTAATFQELGIETERGSTAITKMFQKIGAEPEKFAKVAGIEIGKFKELVNTDMLGAFDAVAAGAKKAGGNNIVFSQILKELDADGSGAGEVLSKLGANHDLLAKKVDTASAALKSSSSITDEFSKKNTNLAANLEKLGKNIDRLFSNSTLSNFFNGIVTGLAELTSKTKTATDAFDDQLKVMVNLKTNIEPLLPRYDELASKTNKSTAEQKEMKTIVEQVAAAIPGAVSEMDKYGNAIGISTDKAKAFIQTEKDRLKVINADALNERNKQLEQITKQYEVLESRMLEVANKVGEKTGQGKGSFLVQVKAEDGTFFSRKATQKEIKELEENFKNVISQKNGLQAEIKRLNGDALQEQIDASKKAAEAAKNAPKTTGGTATNPLGSDGKTKTTKDKVDDDIKELQRLRDEMKKIEDELGMVGFSEYEKGLAQINEKYMQLFEQLQKNKKATIDDFERISKDRNTAIDQYNQKQLQAAQDFIEKRKQLFANDAAKTQLDKDIDAVNDFYKKEIELHKGQTEKIAQLERERGQKLADIKAKYEYEKEVADTNRIFDEKKIQFKGQTAALIQLEEERAIELAQLKGKLNTGGFGNKPVSGDISSIGANDSEQTEAEKKFTYNINQWKNYAGQVFDIMSTLNASVERKEQALLNKELKANDEKKKSIQKLANSKTITEIEARRRIAEVDAESEKKKETLERQQFERSRKMQIAQAIINGAMAITSTLAARPGPLDVLSLGAFRAINIGLAVASTAAQIAAISSTKYAKGGLFNGPLHSEGGMPVVNPATGQKVAELEGGEPILSRNTYANNRAIIDALLHSSTKENGKTISLPSWQDKPYQAINFSGITQSIQQLKFANGGVFNGGGAQANDMTPFIAVMENNQQMLFALMKRLDQPIKVDAKSVISLKQIDDAYTDRNNVKNEAGF